VQPVPTSPSAATPSPIPPAGHVEHGTSSGPTSTPGGTGAGNNYPHSPCPVVQ
jgi:hypothetical protein